MKRQFFSFLFLLTFAVSLSAQKPETASVLDTNLRKHVEYLASDKLEGRRAGEPGANLAGEYVAVQFKKAGLKPGYTGGGKPAFKQPFSYTPVRDPHSAPSEPISVGSPTVKEGAVANATNPQAKITFNVIGILSGHDPVLKNEAIVIGAHYDHLGHGGSGSLAANSTEIHHGADDNASGTAAIIELSHMFAGKGQNRDSNGAGYRNRRTLIFIAFSGEEDGLFGSKYYVNNPVWPLDKTIAMINLDMVGRLVSSDATNARVTQREKTDGKLTVGGIGTANEWEEIVKAQNKIQYFSKTEYDNGGGAVHDEWADYPFELALNQDGFGPSDHSSFYGKNIPVLFFFTNTHLDYHKPSDTFEKINYDGLTKIANYVAAIARAVDKSPSRPTYKSAPASQQNTRMGFSVSLGTIPSYADSTDGMELDGVRDDSPASRAGLKKGDKVIKLAGKDIKNVYDYTAAMGEMKAGEQYEVVIRRGTETLTLKIVPAPAARR